MPALQHESDVCCYRIWSDCIGHGASRSCPGQPCLLLPGLYTIYLGFADYVVIYGGYIASNLGITETHLTQLLL